MTRAGDPLIPETVDRAENASPIAWEALMRVLDEIGVGPGPRRRAGGAWPLNERGASLLVGIGGGKGEPAPAALRGLLEEGRGRSEPSLGEALSQGPELRHVSFALLADETGTLVSMRDHTEERLLQERLLQSEKMASVGQLVSGVAHELNNPLTGVVGFAQLLLARDLDETVRGQVQTIYGEAERAAKIVPNLLSFARRRRPTKEMADVNALLQQVLELRSYDFTIRNVSLDMTLDTRMLLVWVDSEQIQQVFFNLI